MVCDGGAGPGGRVIRVERTGGSSNVAPRLCEVRGNAGMCVGVARRYLARIGAKMTRTVQLNFAQCSP